MTKAEIKKLAEDFFENYPERKSCAITEDGTVFFQRSDAFTHAEAEGFGKPETFAQDEKKVDEWKAEKKRKEEHAAITAKAEAEQRAKRNANKDANDNENRGVSEEEKARIAAEEAKTAEEAKAPAKNTTKKSNGKAKK